MENRRFHIRRMSCPREGAREIEKEFLVGLDWKIALYFFASKQKKLHFFLL